MELQQQQQPQPQQQQQHTRAQDILATTTTTPDHATKTIKVTHLCSKLLASYRDILLAIKNDAPNLAHSPTYVKTRAIIEKNRKRRAGVDLGSENADILSDPSTPPTFAHTISHLLPQKKRKLGKLVYHCNDLIAPPISHDLIIYGEILPDTRVIYYANYLKCLDPENILPSKTNVLGISLDLILDPLTERNFVNALDLITAIKVTLREEHAI